MFSGLFSSSIVRLINIISPIIEDIGARTGLSIPFGRLAVAVCIFSFTIWRAIKISVPHSNSIHTIEKPFELEERTRLTFIAPLTAVSIGNVTSSSTSSAAIPCASVIIVTVGAVKSGNTSTGRSKVM